MAAAQASMSALQLYRNLLKEAGKFASYNYRYGIVWPSLNLLPHIAQSPSLCVVYTCPSCFTTSSLHPLLAALIVLLLFYFYHSLFSFFVGCLARLIATFPYFYHFLVQYSLGCPARLAYIFPKDCRALFNFFRCVLSCALFSLIPNSLLFFFFPFQCGCAGVGIWPRICLTIYMVFLFLLFRPCLSPPVSLIFFVPVAAPMCFPPCLPDFFVSFSSPFPRFSLSIHLFGCLRLFVSRLSASLYIYTFFFVPLFFLSPAVCVYACVGEWVVGYWCVCELCSPPCPPLVSLSLSLPLSLFVCSRPCLSVFFSSPISYAPFSSFFSIRFFI